VRKGSHRQGGGTRKGTVGDESRRRRERGGGGAYLVSRLEGACGGEPLGSANSLERGGSASSGISLF
jgi:hypothetical protein